jgi:hypothetical protein
VRLPRLRFTIRWMMVVVAIVALALGSTLWGLKMRRLARSYALRASMSKQLESKHRGLEARVTGAVQEIEELQQEIGEPGPVREEPSFAAIGLDQMRLISEYAAHSRRLADHHATLRRKYERAARYPWLPVDPDPPEPE